MLLSRQRQIFLRKGTDCFLALATDDDIFICDPEREYVELGKALGTETIRIAAGSADHINAMDMMEGYSDGGNPVIDKPEFVLSLFEQLDRNDISTKEKSIIDCCVEPVDFVQASSMFSNSEFLIVLNQSANDRENLAELLNISPEQTDYITNAPADYGLLKYGGALVPFKNGFSKDKGYIV